jgi:hypothetical protein
MSLINDALKRASKPSARPPAASGVPLQPVNDRQTRSGPLPIILCIVGVGALLMSGAFWLKSKGTSSGSTQQLAQQQQTPVVQTPKEISAAKSAEIPPPVAEKSTLLQNPVDRATATLEKITERAQGVEPGGISQSQTLATSPNKTAELPAVSAAAVPTRPPETIVETPKPPLAAARGPSFRLQAVYFRMKGPTVVINGRTLKVGDTIDGGTLVSIERTSAEVEFQGVKQKLTMH